MKTEFDNTENEALSIARVTSIPLYTKGKWYFQTKADAYTNIIRCDSGKGFETLYIGSCAQSSNIEDQANAQLMAASPDLLEALITLLNEPRIKEAMILSGENSILNDNIKIAYKAIEKALTVKEKGFV